MTQVCSSGGRTRQVRTCPFPCPHLLHHTPPQSTSRLSTRTGNEKKFQQSWWEAKSFVFPTARDAGVRRCINEQAEKKRLLGIVLRKTRTVNPNCRPGQANDRCIIPRFSQYEGAYLATRFAAPTQELWNRNRHRTIGVNHRRPVPRTIAELTAAPN